LPVAPSRYENSTRSMPTSLEASAATEITPETVEPPVGCVTLT
jgi:hypothetical protein